MNAFATSRQYLLEPDWVVAIEEEIAANPAGIAFAIEPGILGIYDAEQGNECDPLKYYRTLGDIELYLIAYKDRAAAHAAAVQEINDTLGVDIEGELQELIDGMEDEMFWARGC